MPTTPVAGVKGQAPHIKQQSFMLSKRLLKKATDCWANLPGVQKKLYVNELIDISKAVVR